MEFRSKQEWPLWRTAWDVAFCAASALATMKAQRVGRPQHWQYSTWIRCGNAIVAYVRTLQLSWTATAADVPPEELKKLEAEKQ